MAAISSMSPGEVRALGGLAISCAGANEASLGMRALSWYNTLLRFGLNIPLVVAHDIGAALLGLGTAYGPPRDLPFLPQQGQTSEAHAALRAYASLREEISKTDVA
jgi:hypothetical protein